MVWAAREGDERGTIEGNNGGNKGVVAPLCQGKGGGDGNGMETGIRWKGSRARGERVREAHVWVKWGGGQGEGLEAPSSPSR